MTATTSRLTFHGVRGSLPVSGDQFSGHGGHTTCIEVEVSPSHRIVLDCGTGLRRARSSRATRFDVLLSHFHTDHIMGLPFFKPLFQAGTSFTFHGHGWEGQSVEQLLTASIRPPWFPIPFGETGSAKQYVDLEDGSGLDLGGIRVSHTRLHHPQGVTAYRLDGPHRSVVLATDVEAGDADSDARLLQLAQGADILIHDAQYTPAEYEAKHQGWGHSTWEHAVEAARGAGVKQLILFHHDPDRTDGDLEHMVAKAARHFPEVTAAREGATLEI